MFERIRTRLGRRGFLGGVAGATAAIAGCEALTSDANETAEDSAETNVPTGDRGPTGLRPPPAYALGVRGARHPAWLVRLCHEDYTTTSRSFEPVGDDLTYGLVPVPGGTVPVLRVVVALGNDTAGEHTAFRLTTAGRRERGLDPLIAVRTDGSTGVNRIYDEVYLNEARFGTSLQGSLGGGTLEAHLRVTGSTGTLTAASTAALCYEVVDGTTGGTRNDATAGGGR